MGQKVNPVGIRLGVVRAHNSTWYASPKNYSRFLLADLRARDYLFKKLKTASVGRITILRPSERAEVRIATARPGMVIGKKYEDLDKLRAALTKIMACPVAVHVEEIKKPDLEARLVAEGIASQLERRVMFRRAMKRGVQNTMRAGAKGIKIEVSGRLGGAEIARTEWYREGRVPLHTLRADIDYATARAETTYGTIGVKVWIFKGEILGGMTQVAAMAVQAAQAPSEEPRSAKKRPAKNDRG